jgi:hypothetical protein
VPLLSQLRTLGFGDSLYYGFEVGELDADMKPGNYFINTNVFISTGGGEPVVQTVSVLFTYREPLTAITPEDAENYAQNYVDALNSGEDLAENSGGIESWHKWLGTDNPRFWVQSKSVKSSGRGGDYEFKVDSVVGGGDAIYTVTVNITLDSNAVYYSEPRYFCVFSQYYTLADALARDYVAALANNDVNALASVIAYDGTKQPDSAAKLGEAQRSIDYYSARYDIASLELSGGLMYGDDRQLFQQVVHDKNGDGFVLNIVYDRGLVSVEPPEQ